LSAFHIILKNSIIYSTKSSKLRVVTGTAFKEFFSLRYINLYLSTQKPS
jgi:hypothetical protein